MIFIILGILIPILITGAGGLPLKYKFISYTYISIVTIIILLIFVRFK